MLNANFDRRQPSASRFFLPERGLLDAPRIHGLLSPACVPGFFLVRPAWAHTCGCKSCCELVTVSKVKRNCMRVTECGEEAWSVNREPMNKNRIEGAAEQGEWAIYHEALVTKAWAA